MLNSFSSGGRSIAATDRAPVGMNVRTVERWLAAGGEPVHRRPPSRSVVMDPFRDYLQKHCVEGQHNGLWTEIKHQGFEGSRATVYRWTPRPQRAATDPSTNSRRRPPSRRNCAWLLGEKPTSLDQPTELFLYHLYENAPELSIADELLLQ
ncbi:MAG: hypothetical protein E5X80_14710 [Mesorhizobium sp.]|uniref:hypothetical protein n=1 Tax=Mesorhizobium sp. TaxID=1871066 RepID=UPI000FE6EFD1|nr:hypothetical protein [Mesorhizobium sp.]RWI31444.1 MAG: hypothetical protein EOR13_26570 [Mesorhizobium sp.]TIO54380.1 MAG: hypothetical protein E5X78_04150 [Mesorhizobium sp.]TIO58139.1 MAG: hypothetical protein E5X79_22865 [Mesorhizobium sp.]TJV63876.1 MAG: hypothetical protein E5X80_14710 [Mesorhizobium sp.]